MQRMPKVTLALENLFFLVLALYLYYVFMGNWLVFFALFLTPDLSIAGYWINNRIGAIMYNSVHNFVLPLVLLILAAVLHMDLLARLSFIFASHIALDRLCGFGLKYPENFKDTHIQRV